MDIKSLIPPAPVATDEAATMQTYTLDNLPPPPVDDGLSMDERIRMKREASRRDPFEAWARGKNMRRGEFAITKACRVEGIGEATAHHFRAILSEILLWIEDARKHKESMFRHGANAPLLNIPEVGDRSVVGLTESHWRAYLSSVKPGDEVAELSIARHMCREWAKLGAHKTKLVRFMDNGHPLAMPQPSVIIDAAPGFAVGNCLWSPSSQSWMLAPAPTWEPGAVDSYEVTEHRGEWWARCRVKKKG